MIIDCHGHFTTVPASFRDWRAKQIEFADDPANAPPLSGAHVTDDEIREGIGNGQLRLQQERGGNLTLFSPIAASATSTQTISCLFASYHSRRWLRQRIPFLSYVAVSRKWVSLPAT